MQPESKPRVPEITHVQLPYLGTHISPKYTMQRILPQVLLRESTMRDFVANERNIRLAASVTEDLSPWFSGDRRVHPQMDKVSTIDFHLDIGGEVEWCRCQEYSKCALMRAVGTGLYPERDLARQSATSRELGHTESEATFAVILHAAKFRHVSFSGPRTSMQCKCVLLLAVHRGEGLTAFRVHSHTF